MFENIPTIQIHAAPGTERDKLARLIIDELCRFGYHVRVVDDHGVCRYGDGRNPNIGVLACGSEKPSGANQIVMERARQVEDEQFSPVRDDAYVAGELARAAAAYAIGDMTPHNLWPWPPEFDKRNKHPRIRQLVISGALCAAEIDRLSRQERFSRARGYDPRTIGAHKAGE